MTTPTPYFQPLFDHMSQEHGLTLTDSEAFEICHAVDLVRIQTPQPLTVNKAAEQPPGLTRYTFTREQLEADFTLWRRMNIERKDGPDLIIANPETDPGEPLPGERDRHFRDLGMFQAFADAFFNH